MKKLRQLSAAALVCALTHTTFAGDMNCPVAPPPPSPGTAQVIDSGTVVASTGGADNDKNTLDPLTDAIWAALEGVMKLF